MAHLHPDLAALYARCREDARRTPAGVLFRRLLDAHMLLTWPIDQAREQESEAQEWPSKPANTVVNVQQISLFPK